MHPELEFYLSPDNASGRTPSWHSPQRRAEMIERLEERDRQGAVIIYPDTEDMRKFVHELKPISRYGSNMIRANLEEGTIWMVHFDIRGIIEIEGRRQPNISGDPNDYRIYNRKQWRKTSLADLPERAKTAPLMVLTPRGMGLETAMRRCQHILDSDSIGEAEIIISKIRQYLHQFSDRRITKKRLGRIYEDFEEFMRKKVLTQDIRGEDRRVIMELLEKAVRGRDRTERINVLVSRTRLNAALLRAIGRSFVEGKIKAKYDTAWTALSIERDISRANLRGVSIALLQIVGHKGHKGHPAFSNEDWVVDASDRMLESQKKVIIDMITAIGEDTTIIRFEPYLSVAQRLREQLYEQKRGAVRMIERNQFSRAKELIQKAASDVKEVLQTYENAHIERPQKSS